MSGAGRIPAKMERNREIYEVWRSGATQRALSERYGICQSRVREILEREMRREAEKRQRGRI